MRLGKHAVLPLPLYASLRTLYSTQHSVIFSAPAPLAAVADLGTVRVLLMPSQPNARKLDQLMLRRYDTKLSAERFFAGLREFIEQHPAFNESCLVEEAAGRARLVGLQQRGGMVFSAVEGPDGTALVFEFRRGDSTLADLVRRHFGVKVLRFRARPAYDFRSFESLAQILLTLRRHKSMLPLEIADAAIESALSCVIPEPTDVFAALDYLRRTAVPVADGEGAEPNPRFVVSKVRPTLPIVMLQQGRKVRLSQRLLVATSSAQSILRIHFATVRGRCLIGYLDVVPAAKPPHEF